MQVVLSLASFLALSYTRVGTENIDKILCAQAKKIYAEFHLVIIVFCEYLFKKESLGCTKHNLHY